MCENIDVLPVIDYVDLKSRLDGIVYQKMEIDDILNFDFYTETMSENAAREKIKKILFDFPFDIFCEYCLVMRTSQSYGSLFQERFRREYNLLKVKSNEHKGDFKSKTKNFEFKMSFLKAKKCVANVVQIRLSQGVYYIVQVIDARNPTDCKLFSTMMLSHEQMTKECKNANAAHGTGKHADELRLDLDLISINRWVQDYGFVSDDL